MTLLNRNIAVDKKYLLLKLLNFTDSKGKP